MNSSNNLDEQALIEKLSSKVNNIKPKKNQTIAYILIGIGLVMTIFLVAEMTGLIGSKEPKPEINAQAVYESRLIEQEKAIEQAEKEKQVAELRKQATELELQALTIQGDEQSN